MDAHLKNAFDKIKWIFTRNALLIYPDFNELFDIHADASEFQLEAAIRKKRQNNLLLQP